MTEEQKAAIEEREDGYYVVTEKGREMGPFPQSVAETIVDKREKALASERK